MSLTFNLKRTPGRDIHSLATFNLQGAKVAINRDSYTLLIDRQVSNLELAENKPYKLEYVPAQEGDFYRLGGTPYALVKRQGRENYALKYQD